MTQIFYTIYKITNLINGKIYIGKHQTDDLLDRYMGSGKFLLRAIKKYGIENFKKDILFQFETELEMNEKEKELVTEEFCNREDTYNICLGGQGGFSHINSNEIFRKAKNKKARQTTDKILLEKHGVTNASQIPSVGEKIGKKSKERHEKGEMNHVYFHNRSDFQSIIEKNKSPESITKRKETFKKIGHSQGSKNSQYGTMWINNGIQSKKIKKDQSIPIGWSRGRKISF